MKSVKALKLVDLDSQPWHVRDFHFADAERRLNCSQALTDVFLTPESFTQRFLITYCMFHFLPAFPSSPHKVVLKSDPCREQAMGWRVWVGCH